MILHAVRGGVSSESILCKSDCSTGNDKISGDKIIPQNIYTFVQKTEIYHQ